MDIARLVLDYMRATLSLPVVVGVLGVVVLVMFKKDLRDLLSRIAKLRLPGGGEVTLSQAEKSLREPKLPEPTPAPAVPDNPTPNQIHNTIAAYEATARMWEFRYLNCFLAPDTQMMLDQAATKLDVELLDLLYSTAERDAILDVLLKHHLVEQKGVLLPITDKGREYIKFRGPLPPARVGGLKRPRPPGGRHE
jgi:hypothetical protein